MQTERSNKIRRLNWGIVGVSMVTLAVGLAVIGIVMAFQQAHSVASTSLDELQLRARFIALTASEQVHNKIQLALREFAKQSCEFRSVDASSTSGQTPHEGGEFLSMRKRCSPGPNG